MIASDREKGLLVITVVILLYGALYMTYEKQRAKFDAIMGERKARTAQLELERDLIAQRGVWEEAYSKNATLMPVFDPGAKVETHWLNMIDRLAKESGLTIIRRQVGEEKMDDDVYELPIECREWEGTLESLVKFLYAVNSEGAMLDVRKLTVRPASGKAGAGTLRGSLTVYCAYLRSENDEAAAEQIIDNR